MYGVSVVTPPSEPAVSAEQLRARLRLNDDSEDTELAEMLAAAVELWEHDTNRPVITTTYRQDLSAWPHGPIVLGRGGVTSVDSVSYYDADGTPIALEDWVADILTPPARVTLSGTPPSVTTAAGVAVSPVGCVEFTAGWEPGAVPAGVLTALKLMVGHYYENREAWREGQLTETPDGWRRFTARYKLGLSGSWGQ